jgi:hypothetical protein
MFKRIVKAVLSRLSSNPQEPKMCVSTPCECTNHLWVEMSNQESPDFELCGRSGNGKMVYLLTVQKHYKCSNCGEGYSRTSRKRVYH